MVYAHREHNNGIGRHGARPRWTLSAPLLTLAVLVLTSLASDSAAATGARAQPVPGSSGVANVSLGGIALGDTLANLMKKARRGVLESLSVNRGGDQVSERTDRGTLLARLYQGQVVEIETTSAAFLLGARAAPTSSTGCKSTIMKVCPTAPTVHVGSTPADLRAVFGAAVQMAGGRLYLVGTTTLQGSVVHTYFDVTHGKVSAIRLGYYPWLNPCYGGPTMVSAAVLRGGSLTWGLRGCPYLVTTSVTLAAGTTLTVQAGVTVKFAGPTAGIVVDGGALLAQGTADLPVTFTSASDQNHGAISSKSPVGKGLDLTRGVGPKPGDWAGLATGPAGGLLSLRHAGVYFAGAREAGVMIGPAHNVSFVLQDSIIAYNHTYGVNAAAAPGDTVIQRTAFFGNDRPLQISAAMSLDGSNVFAPQGLTPNTQNGIWLPWRAVIAATGTKVVWAENRTPFVLVDATSVASGGTLELGPGVTLKGTDSSASLLIDGGTLLANGTPTQPVVFTSLADNAHRGATGGIRGAAPRAGDWGGLATGDKGATVTLRNGQILYAGAGGYNHAGLLVNGNGTPLVDVEHCTFAMNSGWGLDAGGAPSTTKIEDTTFYGNDKPLQINGAISLDNTNAFHGPQPNKQNGVFLVDGAHVDQGTTTLSAADAPFVVIRGLSINQGGTLTLGPGVILKGIDTGAAVQVNGGSLTVSGTADKPVVMTSFMDDAHGGDTNGDGAATSPHPGDWLGLAVSGSSQATMTHLQIFYGASDTFHTGTLRVEDNAVATIADSEVAQSAGNGIYIATSRTASITNTSVHNNMGFGIDFTDASRQQATTQSGNTLATNAKGDLGVADQPATGS